MYSGVAKLCHDSCTTGICRSTGRSIGNYGCLADARGMMVSVDAVYAGLTLVSIKACSPYGLMLHAFVLVLCAIEKECYKRKVTTYKFLDAWSSNRVAFVKSSSRKQYTQRDPFTRKEFYATNSKALFIQLLKAYRIKFQKFAAHAHKDALINETFIPT